jgi:pimeloyl-ACP methyl ester carboxylesterase
MRIGLRSSAVVALAALVAARAPRASAQAPATAYPGADPGADEWYMPTADKKVSIYVRELGTGSDTVVVVHGGFGVDHSYLLPAVRGLESSAHFVFYDQRGSLRSPAADSLISVQAHIRDLEELRQSLGLERMTLVAHSMGTWLAMSYLQAHPDRVRGLILLGAIPPVSDSGLGDANKYGTVMMNRPEVTAELHRLGLDTPTLTPRQATHAWRVRFAAVNVYHVDRWRLMQGSGRAFYNGSAGNAASRTMPARWDFMPVLRAHPCPVYVMVGTDDYVDWRAEKWQAAAKTLPALRLTILPQAGHASWIDQPELVRTTLDGALRESARCLAR